MSGPIPTARALARGTSGAVGVLLTDSLQHAFTDEVATAFLSSIVDGLAPTGLALTLLTSDGRDDVVPARDVAIDGAVLYSCHVESAARDWLLRRKLPLVFVDQHPVPGISSVNVDDRGGARAAAQHLVDLGHRRIGILNAVVDGATGIVDNPLVDARAHPPRQRMLGWLEALHAAGIQPTVAQTPSGGAAHAGGTVHALLTLEPRPTAVLCFSDVLAIEVIRVARRSRDRRPRRSVRSRVRRQPRGPDRPTRADHRASGHRDQRAARIGGPDRSDREREVRRPGEGPPPCLAHRARRPREHRRGLWLGREPLGRRQRPTLGP